MAATVDHLPKLECANCGDVGDLLRCSRCRNIFFCSAECQRAYWPLHKSECKRNEFADAVEHAEPRFAAWMRNHGKQAVLKDDEVERLERARKATTGLSHGEVMESMFGRARPKPLLGDYTDEEVARMRAREAEEKSKRAALTTQDKAWACVPKDEVLGRESARMRWRQNRSYVEVHLRLPRGCPPSTVRVTIRRTELSAYAGEAKLLAGTLHRPVKAEECVWLIQDGVLEITLLKESRKGCLADGETVASTFWRAVLKDSGEDEAIPDGPVPTAYYESPADVHDMEPHRRVKSSGRPMIDRSREM